MKNECQRRCHWVRHAVVGTRYWGFPKRLVQKVGIWGKDVWEVEQALSWLCCAGGAVADGDVFGVVEGVLCACACEPVPALHVYIVASTLSVEWRRFVNKHGCQRQLARVVLLQSTCGSTL